MMVSGLSVPSLLLVITSQVVLSKDTVVTDLIVETTTFAAHRISSDVSRYPSVANYDNLDYFRSRISVLDDGSILAGAFNKLYFISGDLSTTRALLTWNPTDTRICNLAFRSSTLCGNHIRIHKVQADGNTVLVCGTDAILPKCRLTTLDSNLTADIGTIITPQPGLVPFHPDFKGLTIDNDAFPNGILAVNYLDAAQEDFGISYQFVDTTGGMIDNTIQYRSIQGSDNWLLTPAAFVDYYADSYTADDSLSFYFIFLTENAIEISGTDNAIIYSRVVRICKNDPGVGIIRGADPEFRADYFKTYVKAYIYCEKSMPSGADSVPEKVSLVRNSTYRIGVASRDRVVYGLFTGPRYGPPGSAICVYSADMSDMKDKGIFTVFSEKYRNLRPGQTACVPNNVPNDNSFTCDPATHNTSRTLPEFDVLIDPAVDQLTTDPLVKLNGITATSIYTTQALVCDSSVSACTSVNHLIDLDVMLVGTNDGKILKIVMTYNGTDHVPLISEELSLSDSLPIQTMEPQFVDGEFDHLLLSTDSYIYRIPPYKCDRFMTCGDCIKARDPHCFWNQHSDPAQQGCKRLPNRATYDPQTWYQDINGGNATQWTNCSASMGDDASIARDPHFYLPLANGDHLCFSVQGEPNFAFNLINDHYIQLNGQFVLPAEDESNAIANVSTFLGDLGMVIQNQNAAATKAVVIHVSAQDHSVKVGNSLTVVKEEPVVVNIFNNMVTISVSTNKQTTNLTKAGSAWLYINTESFGIRIRFYKKHLDMYFTKTSGLSKDVHGLIGQFLVADVIIDKENMLMKLGDRSPFSVKKDKAWPYLGVDIECWYGVDTDNQGAGLIEGVYTDYIVDHLIPQNI